MESNTEWIHWGRRDPLYGVALWEGRQKGGPRAWTDEEFYELGRSDWEDFRFRWERYGLGLGSCVEIGCGAGRLTMQLARSFERVHALDVSPEMLAYARERITAPNVDFEITEGRSLPVPDMSVSAVFSTHVFQHFDSLADGESYFREIHRVLAPAGTAMVHLPMHRLPPGGQGAVLRAATAVQKLRSDIGARRERRRIRQGGDSGLMRYLSYEVGWLEQTLPGIGFVDVELLSFAVRSNGAWHPFVLARKSAQT